MERETYITNTLSKKWNHKRNNPIEMMKTEK